jgi:hypothetical protein
MRSNSVAVCAVDVSARCAHFWFGIEGASGHPSARSPVACTLNGSVASVPAQHECLGLPTCVYSQRFQAACICNLLTCRRPQSLRQPCRVEDKSSCSSVLSLALGHRSAGSPAPPRRSAAAIAPSAAQRTPLPALPSSQPGHEQREVAPHNAEPSSVCRL